MTIEQHYNVLAPRLTNWLVASGSTYAEACDLVQDTFVKVWRMKDDLHADDDAAVSGLVFTIARNLRKNMARDDRRLVFGGTASDPAEGSAVSWSDTDGGAAPQSPAARAGDGPIMPSDAAYLRRRLNEAFACLPPVLREAYTLFQIAELPVREIARQTGTTENLVKVRIFRAKEKLKEILADLRVTF